MLNQLIQNLGSLLGGYGQTKVQLKQQQFANEMELANFALQQAESEARVTSAGAHTEAIQTGTQISKATHERNILASQATLMAEQLGQLRAGITEGMVNANDPNVKKSMSALWKGYRPLLEKLIPGYTPPTDPYEVLRTLTPEQMTAIAPVAGRIDINDPKAVKVFADAARITPELVVSLGKQRLLAPEAAEMGTRMAGIESQERVATKGMISEVILNASKNASFLSLPDREQKAYLSGVLSGIVDPAQASTIAGQIPTLNQAVDANVAAQIANQLKLGEMQAQVDRERMAQQAKLEREQMATQKWIAQMHIDRDMALGKMAQEGKPSRGGWNPYGGAQNVDPMKARQNLIALRKGLDDPRLAGDMSEDQKYQIYCAMADNLSVISMTIGGRFIEPEILAGLIMKDPTPNETSWPEWQLMEGEMVKAGWPQEYIEWFYKERYEPVFGAKKVGYKARSTGTKKK